MRRAAAVALSAALSVTAGACGDAGTAANEVTNEVTTTTDAATTPDPTTAPAATASPAGTPAPGTPAPGTPGAASPGGTTSGEDLPEPGTDTTETSGFPDMTGDTAYLTDVELGDHEDYERVVFTFAEDSPVPAWRVEYTEQVSQPGSGNPVEVAGGAALHVILSGGTGVDMSGTTFEEVYTGPERLSGEDASLSAVTEVVLAGDFEAVMEWGIGVDEQRPFRAFSLQDPSRLVVDVMTE